MRLTLKNLSLTLLFIIAVKIKKRNTPCISCICIFFVEFLILKNILLLYNFISKTNIINNIREAWEQYF